MSYKGLILDFGGVVTTDFYGALSAFSVREGLDAGAFVRVLRETAEEREAVRRARVAGIRIAALSNSWGTGDYDPYDGYELDDLFDAVVISDQVGLRKPSTAIYELTASKIGLPPDDCLFVDDTEANLPPARELGMGTLFFKGADGEIAEIERLIGIA
jgi:putative hydrolase of the HAD superfamily